MMKPLPQPFLGHNIEPKRITQALVVCSHNYKYTSAGDASDRFVIDTRG